MHRHPAPAPKAVKSNLFLHVVGPIFGRLDDLFPQQEAAAICIWRLQHADLGSLD